MPSRFISDLTGTMRSFFKIGATLRLKNNNGTLEVRNGDDTARAPLTAGNLALGSVFGSQKLNMDGHINFESLYPPGAPTVALAGLGAGNLSNSSYWYAISFVTASGETSLGGNAMVTVVNNALDGQVRLTNIPVGPSDRGVIARRIHRSKVGAGIRYLLATINDNTTTTFIDNVPDTSLSVETYFQDNSTAGALYAFGGRVFFPGYNSFYAGQYAGNATPNGWGNVFVGTYAGNANAGGNGNTLLGYEAGRNNSVGYGNVFIAYRAGRQNTSGSYNIFIGADSGYSNTSGSYNAMVGNNAGGSNVSGECNAFFGIFVGGSNNGSRNTFIGYAAGNSNSGGSNNVALGYSAGSWNTDGGSNTAVGAFAGVPQYSVYANTTCLGANSTVTGSNQLQLGSASTTTYAYGAVQNRSDARWKEQIEDVPVGLDFILKLKPRQYKMKDFTIPAAKQVINGEEREIAPAREYTFKRKHYGLIGQEVKQAMDALDIDFGGYQDHSVNGGEDVLTLGYTEFIAPIIRAIQELHAQVEDHGKQLAQLGPKTRRSS